MQWPAVVGVQDAPGLDMGDGALDRRAEAGDPGIEFLLPVQQFPACRFLIRGEVIGALVAFIRDDAEGSGENALGRGLPQRPPYRGRGRAADRK